MFTFRSNALHHTTTLCRRPHSEFAALKWSRSEAGWRSVTLRVTAYGLEALERSSGTVRWRCDYVRLSTPGVLLLAPYSPPPPPAGTGATAAAGAVVGGAGGGSTVGGEPGVVDGLFAVMTRTGRSAPRIFALRSRDALLSAMQQAARKKLACHVAGAHHVPHTCCGCRQHATAGLARPGQA